MASLFLWWDHKSAFFGDNMQKIQWNRILRSATRENVRFADGKEKQEVLYCFQQVYYNKDI